ncbi:sugar ABC transporter permease [Paenibacillus doosanensis]|uniref:Lactose transport system permease protein LacF n=1 Tax=Paenibacillus konkukensis TaxID=2020716 RepID=A0ABY4RI15_9BACL|nr:MULTISPECIES: sugar ABC transporter permease [Paenibacillus]MCS7461677.1 sugar ABC transporter permease [Paenibacillus doosanensis]UQZ82104.1 Lactose transport system permease protein LacF [Paenibacillus konkukensis]
MRISSFLKKDGIGYLFLSPWIIGMLAFTFIPIVFSLYFSFTDYEMFNSPKWVGLDNYKNIFTNDEQFLEALSVTFRYVLIAVPLELAFALSIALMLNKGLAGLRIYRAVYYIPSLFGGSVAIALLWRQVFGAKGLFNVVLGYFGLDGVSWIATPEYALYTLIALKIWQFGSPMIIFLAGLQQIPTELYEAAAIDGAGKRSQFFRVTIPMLTPIIFFNLVMQIIHAFQAFTPAYVVSGGTGGPLNSTLFYTLYLYQKGFVSFQMGYASALAWILLVIIAIFTCLTFLSSKKWVHYE